ncbi:hypothetical protein Kpol_1002p12 [Vanderwaltozyma polyspora DSM 70294]|uniref:DNA-binding TFAR19-related protein n=1 Tax=Vanderwaltozyma polyspora (strain ATCC 22028 / DSM 70294 / BCRC 21397 / CBS 2163 / NBRC 10782 / NRRL Y-8283 / UCD 57-17) TaxID=436907 RepID=A7TE45_VANPO|nr:uncharacterized protein Kpol_1002p12 [Vanderwaltozyma polyspora DSM 70294]EDO19367.1 hypothetical protein Kpol_1002p12 [Vanderwaltozyma polyspora DSM 70294]
MDSELQALREARLAELKRGTASGGDNASGRSGNGGGEPVGSAIASFLEPEALERLTRVSLVRPDRAQAVEQYLKQIIGTGQVSHKVTEDEIVHILNGIAREQKKKNDVKIIFDRKEHDFNDTLDKKGDEDDDEDDFFD